MGAFADSVSAFCRETPERMTAVWRMAVQDTVEAMTLPVGAGGNMPIDTGFLRNSIAATKGTSPPSNPLVRNPGGAFSYDASDINLTILSTTPMEGMTILFTAEYAIYVEFGARGRVGRRFMGLAVQRWPQIVAAASNSLEARIKNG